MVYLDNSLIVRMVYPKNSLVVRMIYLDNSLVVRMDYLDNSLVVRMVGREVSDQSYHLVNQKISKLVMINRTKC